MKPVTHGAATAVERMTTRSAPEPTPVGVRPGLREECRTRQDRVAARWSDLRERVLGVLIRSVPAGGIATELAWSFIAGLYVVDFALRLTTACLIPVVVAVLRVEVSGTAAVR